METGWFYHSSLEFLECSISLSWRFIGADYRQKGHGSGCINDKRKQSSVRQGIHSEYQQKISDFLLLDWLIAFVKPGDDQRQKHTDRIAGTIVV